MDTRTFLERVLPAEGGQYIAGSVYPSGYKQGKPLDTLEALLKDIEARNRRKENVFYATGVYDGRRTIDGTRLKKCLYVDLDTTGSHKGFADKKAAVLGLKKFCDEAPFPFPNILVDSGGGVHAYWTFDQPVAAKDWQVMADSLKALCETHDFAVDESITADPARILRVPGTFNYKDPSHPRPCRILKFDVNDFEVARLREALGVGALPAASPLLGTVDDDDLGANLYGERVYHAGDMVHHCGVLKHAVDTGGKGQPGTLWFRILHLLAYCEDGRDFIHLVSKDHEEYSADRTERRFAYALQQKSRGVGPTLCKTFGQFYPAKCAVCPHAAKVKTPLVLGRAEESYLPPAYKMSNEGVWKAVSFNERGQAEDWQLVFPYKIAAVELITDGHNISLRFVLSDGPISRTIVIPVTLLAAETKELQSTFMLNEVYPTDAQVKEFKQVMIPWVRKMVKVKQAVRASISGLGWSKIDTKVGFATGTSMYLEDGSIEPVSGLDRQLCRDYSPAGDPTLWKETAKSVLSDSSMPATCGVLSAFAAPLIKFTGVSGVMLSLYSAASGTGKSSALRVAQAVWGDPQRGINALNDTALSVAKKMGFLNNLPAYWDELRMRDEVQNLIKMIFQLGQGKERSRLTSGAKMQDMGTWSTLITVATNEPVLDHIDHVISNTNAGRLRVFEVEVPERRLDDHDLPFKLKELDLHHGHVGQEYAALLAKNHNKIRDAVQAMQKKVVAETRATNDERFWVAIVATLLVAASLAAKLGWVHVDPADLKRYLYRELVRQRGAVKKAYKPGKDRAYEMLIQFTEEQRDQILVCDHLVTQQQRSPGSVHIQPARGEIVGVIAVKDRMLRLKRQVFNAWVYEHAKDSPSEILKHLITAGAKEVRASVTAGLANTLDARVYCIDVDLNHSELSHLIEGG